MQLLLNSTRRSMLKTAGWVLPLAVVFPIIVHLIPPYNGIPIGAYLLPMFYVPLVVVAWYRLSLALMVAFFAPIINFLITGNPNWGFLTILTLEIVFFTALTYFMLKGNLKWVAAPLAYISAKVLSSLLLFIIPLLDTAPINFFFASLTNAAAGILVLLIINILCVRYNPSTKSGS
jgi:hypothetical protein